MTPQFELTSVQKIYGTKVALDIEKLMIWPRRIYVIMGPNGCGKSTLLHTIALLVEPDEGDMLFDGQPVTWKPADMQRLRQRVTIMHQRPFIYAGTVFDNVAFGLKLRKVPAEEIRQRVSESLAMVGLAGFEQRNARRLSGGETRRVAAARALVLKPEVLLLDEPFANLDKESAAVLNQLIASLPAKGTTVGMVTHAPDATFAGSVIQVHLEEGKVVDVRDHRTEAPSNPGSPPS
jgi:tungstate transport system ATP-binding protein